MAFKEVEKAPEEKGIPPYWKPEQVGDAIEGNIYEFDESVYNGKPQTRINLYCGENEEGESIMSLLPAHADLKRTYVNLVEDCFTRVEVTDIEEPKVKGSNPKFIYKVLQDVEDKMDFPDKQDKKASEYTAETVADDYYED